MSWRWRYRLDHQMRTRIILTNRPGRGQGQKPRQTPTLHPSGQILIPTQPAHRRTRLQRRREISCSLFARLGSKKTRRRLRPRQRPKTSFPSIRPMTRTKKRTRHKQVAVASPVHRAKHRHLCPRVQHHRAYRQNLQPGPEVLRQSIILNLSRSLIVTAHSVLASVPRMMRSSHRTTRSKEKI